MRAVYLCVLHLILSLVNINGIRFKNVIHSKHRIAFGEPLSLQRPDLKSGPIFETFLSNLLDVLAGFPGKQLERYCRVLYRNLRDLEFRHTKSLAKHMRDLSRMYRDDIKAQIDEYRNLLQTKPPKQVEFLEAMNPIFTLKENILFNDYVFDLRDYGKEDKLYIEDETKKLINAIVDCVFKLSYNDRRNLERKMRQAIKEHKYS